MKTCSRIINLWLRYVFFRKAMHKHTKITITTKFSRVNILVFYPYLCETLSLNVLNILQCNVSLYGARFTKLTQEHSKLFKGTELSDDNTII